MTTKIDNVFINLLRDIFVDEFAKPDILTNMDQLHLLLNTDKINEHDKKHYLAVPTLGVNDRKCIFVNTFHKHIDADTNTNTFLNKYYDFIKEYIKPLFPNEDQIVIQKTPNLRISFPNLTAIGAKLDDPEGIIGLHKDSDFGHHKDEINFIIPITEMYDTNSIYYEPYADSLMDYDQYLNLKLNTNEMFTEKFNKLKHYNKINITNKTRISFDLRIIPYSKYMEDIEFFRGTKFELGKYYISL